MIICSDHLERVVSWCQDKQCALHTVQPLPHYTFCGGDLIWLAALCSEFTVAGVTCFSVVCLLLCLVCWCVVWSDAWCAVARVEYGLVRGSMVWSGLMWCMVWSCVVHGVASLVWYGLILCSSDVGSGAERDQLICYLDCFVSDVYLIHSISEDFKYKIEAIAIPAKIVFVY